MQPYAYHKGKRAHSYRYAKSHCFLSELRLVYELLLSLVFTYVLLAAVMLSEGSLHLILFFS